MKKKHTVQLRYRIASRQTISGSAPARRSLSKGGVFNLRTAICLAFLYAAAVSARADIITVTNTDDSGPGANLLAVSRAANAAPFRIFHVMFGHSVIIEGLTISNGSVLNTFGGG